MKMSIISTTDGSLLLQYLIVQNKIESLTFLVTCGGTAILIGRLFLQWFGLKF